MSYGFMVWAVDTDKLQAVAGSKDEKLRRMIGGRFKRDMARLDDLLGGEPGVYEALRQIVDGNVPPSGPGAVYRYAFKLLVEHFGRFLDNNAVYPWSSPDFGPVNAALEAMKVPFSPDKFYGMSLPVKLPYPDDFPMSGWVDAATVKTVDEAFSKAKEADMDPETAGIVRCVRGWFRDAAGLGRGLVAFYH